VIAVDRLTVTINVTYTLWGKKIAPFYFCNNCQTALYFDNFWHADTGVNLQQNCNIIAHLS